MNIHRREIGGLQVVELPGDPKQGTIVLFHGFGADAMDLFPLSNVYKGPTWIFPQAPLQVQFMPGYVGRAWFPIDMEVLSKSHRENSFEDIASAFPPDLTQVSSIANRFVDQLDTPRSKLVLGGFSQGAILAVETMLSSMIRCGGLLIFSGTYLESLRWKPKIHPHANTHFFQSHGMHDPLLPLRKAEELEKLLLEGGLHGRLHTFQGGHEIPPSILSKLSLFLQSLFAFA